MKHYAPNCMLASEQNIQVSQRKTKPVIEQLSLLTQWHQLSEHE